LCELDGAVPSLQFVSSSVPAVHGAQGVQDNLAMLLWRLMKRCQHHTRRRPHIFDEPTASNSFELDKYWSVWKFGSSTRTQGFRCRQRSTSLEPEIKQAYVPSGHISAQPSNVNELRALSVPKILTNDRVQPARMVPGYHLEPATSKQQFESHLYPTNQC
jgi:hypothetical protein